MTIVEVSKTGFGGPYVSLGAVNISYANNQVRSGVFEAAAPFAADLQTDALYFRVRTATQSSFILWASALKVEVIQACP